MTDILALAALWLGLALAAMLTFGSISALFGLSHGIVSEGQYSFLIAAVIGSAVVPTLIAKAFFLPHHLISHTAGGHADEATGASAPGIKALPANETKR